MREGKRRKEKEREREELDGRERSDCFLINLLLD